MLTYGIEKIKKKSNKKTLIVVIVVLSIVIITVAILVGKKVAEYKVEKQRQITSNEQEIKDLINLKNQKELNVLKREAINKNKLTEEQFEKINNIYISEEKRVFLTFDDGPSSLITPKILEILEKENIQATFFVLGTMVKHNPKILKQEREKGHFIGNHGYSHIYKKIYKNKESVLAEYNKTDKCIQEALGELEYKSNVFRFPGGLIGGRYYNIKKGAKKLLEEEGIAVLDWNCLTDDSEGANTKEKVMKKLKETCKNKNSVVVLMHDAPNKNITVETLPDVILYFREQGYVFKNLYDIL